MAGLQTTATQGISGGASLRLTAEQLIDGKLLPRGALVGRRAVGMVQVNDATV